MRKKQERLREQAKMMEIHARREEERKRKDAMLSAGAQDFGQFISNISQNLTNFAIK